MIETEIAESVPMGGLESGHGGWSFPVKWSAEIKMKNIPCSQVAREKSFSGLSEQGIQAVGELFANEVTKVGVLQLWKKKSL